MPYTHRTGVWEEGREEGRRREEGGDSTTYTPSYSWATTTDCCLFTARAFTTGIQFCLVVLVSFPLRPLPHMQLMCTATCWKDITCWFLTCHYYLPI